MNTKWLGLWAQERHGFYAGQVIKKSDIPAYTRVVLRYNKFYKSDTKRPKFIFCFADSEGYEDKCIPIEYEEYKENESKQAIIDELADVMRQGHNGEEWIMLPSESAARADRLQKRAIELVEELTGEEWEFAYTYFG